MPLSFKTTLPITFLIGVLSIPSHLVSQTYSLKQCEKLALKNNILIQDARKELEIAQAKSLRAKHANILPTFNLTNLWGPIPQLRAEFDENGNLTSPDSTGINALRFFTQLEIDMEQPLFSFGRFSGGAQAAHYRQQATEAKIKAQTDEVIMRVRQLYWGMQLGKELLVVIENARSEVAKAKTKIQDKLEQDSEDVSQIDLFKLQTFEYEINKRHNEAITKLALAKSTLLAALGLEKDTDFAPEESLLEITPEIRDLNYYYDVALSNRPELKRLNSLTNAERSELSAERSQYYPHFFLRGDISYNFAKDRFDPDNPFLNNNTNYFRPVAAVGYSYNLNFWKTRSKMVLGELNLKKAITREEALRQDIRAEVKRIYLKILRSDENLKDSKKALRASENWLRSASMSFDIGVGEIKNLIDASKANGAMKGEYYRNIFEYNSSMAELSKAIALDIISQE